MCDYAKKAIERARIEDLIAKLLGYYMADINWNQNELSTREKTIVTNQVDLDSINDWMEERR